MLVVEVEFRPSRLSMTMINPKLLVLCISKFLCPDPLGLHLYFKQKKWITVNSRVK